MQRGQTRVAMNWVTTVTLIGFGVYVAWLAVTLLIGVVRGDIDPQEIERISRGWGNVDADVYDGEWGTRDNGVWCDWCHRYHDR
jgi:hypothetical protein